MKELAIDTLNKTKVIISRDRKNRPMDNILDESCNSCDEYDETCPFCRGNEKNIEEETFVINKNSKWIVKSVRNKYPIIDNNKLNKIKGEHDVIIDNYKHNANFYNMSEEECKNEFGTRLKRLIYYKGFTQEDLSNATGISKTMINGYITGKINPSFYKVDKICKALGCSMDRLRFVTNENDK